MKILILCIACITAIGFNMLAAGQTAAPNTVRPMTAPPSGDLDQLLLTGVPFGGRSGNAASSSSSGLGEGGIGGLGSAYDELDGLCGGPTRRGIGQGVFSMDVGGTNALIVATSYSKQSSAAGCNLAGMLKLQAVDASSGLVLWTATLEHNYTND